MEEYAQPPQVMDVDGNSLIHKRNITSSTSVRLPALDFAGDLSAYFPNFTDLRMLYAANHLYAIRARDVIRGLHVVLKACLDTEHTDSSTRIRHGEYTKRINRNLRISADS